MSRIQKLLRQLPPLEVQFPTAPKDFTLFPNLPIELRRRIWKHACYQPREVKLYVLSYWSPVPSIKEEGHNAVPAILQTCQESRVEGLKYYTACIECSRTLSNWIKISKVTFINFAVDRFVHTCAKCNEDNQNQYLLYYVSIAQEYNFSTAVLAEMKHLALDITSCRCHVSSKLNDIQNLQDNVREHAKEINIFTLTLGPRSIWFGHVEKRLEQWREEVVQRDLIEMVIPRIRRHSRAYGWNHVFQVEYKMNGKVVFCESGEKLQEYQGVFRFNPDLRQFLG